MGCTRKILLDEDRGAVLTFRQALDGVHCFVQDAWKLEQCEVWVVVEHSVSTIQMQLFEGLNRSSEDNFIQ